MDARTAWRRHDAGTRLWSRLSAWWTENVGPLILGPFEAWGVWAVRPWRPVGWSVRDRKVMGALLAINGGLAAGFLRLGFPSLALGLAAGAGILLVALSAGAAGLIPWVVTELDGRAERRELEALAVVTSCALAAAAWAAGLRAWVVLLAFGVLWIGGLVDGVARIVGLTRVRAAAVVYLAFQIGVLGTLAAGWIFLRLGFR
jgi:hypothetical protein